MSQKNDQEGEFSSVEIDELKLMHVAKLAEVGMSVAAVAHEVRQPLSALKMALQMMREKVIDNYELRADLDEALQQARRIEMLIERTRSFLAPSRGKITLNLAEVAEGVASLLKWQGKMGKRHSELELELDRQIPMVTADRSMVEQLMSNLIVNARDAADVMESGKIFLKVAMAEDGSGVDLIVADNGKGIDPSILPNLFEPFFTTKGASSGTGLGLYIVKRVADDHEATIRTMERTELEMLGKGRLSTGFKITFPLNMVRSSVSPPPESRAQADHKRALIVDDEIAVLKILGKVMEQEGFEGVLSESGEDALDKLEKEQFSILVIDKNLPGASGMDVAKLARNMDPAMPILIITGYASEGSALEALSLGVSDYVLKPLDLGDFRSRVNKVMQFAEEEAKVKPHSTLPPVMDEDLDGMDVGVKVLLVEEQQSIQDVVSDALIGLGCEVAAFANDDMAAAKVRDYPFQVIIARPDTLRRRKDWFMHVSGVLGAIAIMDRSGVDKTIEAIHLGARGVFAPPFDNASIAFDFRRAVSRLLTENQ